MKQILKRLFSFAMAVMMVLSLVPFNGLEVYAADGNEPVAKIDEQGYETLAEALTAAKTMTGNVTVELYDKVTLNSSLSGSFDSIKFIGKSEAAEIYLDVQGYITATGKKVAFEDLILSKAQGGYITNAGFMNVAFGVYDVAEVTYTNCTFANGAYASSGEVTYNGCTFYRSWDKYGLWAYGNVDVTVDGCTFADYRGIKMYAEGAAKTVELAVKNTNFAALTDKPAIVLTYGESVTLENNTYSSTGAFELDLDGAPNGTAVSTDVYTITCKNDNGACGVLVDGKMYTTIAQAAEVATSGSKVILLYDPAETVELAEGVILDKNGYTAAGVSVAAPSVAKVGDTYYETLQAAIDAATEAAGTYEIVLLPGTIAENVIIHQTEGVNITIKGNGTDTVFTGHVEIYGHARNQGAETLTFDGVVFETDVADHVFIEQTCQTSTSESMAKCYPHNVTVRNCTFTATGAAVNTAVGMKYRYGYNIQVKDTTSTGLHSLMQNYAGVGLNIDNVTITGKNGISLGTSQNVSVTNSTINATGYGLRIDAQLTTTTEIANCEIEAFIPVVVRKAEQDYTLVVDGTNTMTATNADGLWCVIGMEEYGDVEKDALTAAAGKIVVTLNDAGLNKAGVYGAYKAPVTGSLGTCYIEENTERARVYGEILGMANAEQSVVVKLYSGETLLATTTLAKSDYLNSDPLGVNIVISGKTSSSWNTVWEAGHPRSDMCPDKAVLYIDGAQKNTATVTLGTIDDLGAPYVWEEITGVEKIVTGLKGAGTESDPYLIGCVEELLWFQAKVDEQAADGSTQFAGKYFKLTADIDLAGINWNPIGSMSGDHGSFKGVFDGDGHTISNLNCQQTGNGLGLFARTAGNAQIKNLTLNNVTVKSTDNSNYVGAVVGNSYASTKITNVHVTGAIDISGCGYIGGISGHGYVVMDNVSVVGEGTISSTFWCAGGILGYGGEGATNIMNAKVEGTGETGLTITSAAGGLGSIVGMAEDNNGTQPISGSNLSAKNVNIKTYTGAYGDAYANYALGYLYGGNPTSKLTGELKVENVKITTSNGEAPEAVDVVATVGDAIYFNLQSALDAAVAGTGNVTVEILRDVNLTDVDWNPVTVSGPGYPLVTVNGNNKTITGLNDMLFAGTWAGKSGLIINDLTIKGSTIVNDKDDAKGTVGVGAFIGYPQASATITLNNCHLVDSRVEGGHWTGGLIGMAGGYNGNDGPVFMKLTITGCSVTGSTITGKGSAGGVMGHGSCAAWTNVVIEDTTVTGNTITSTGSSANKAGSVMGTIGAAGQPATANGETKTGGAFVSVTTSGNTVTSNGTTITTIYGRQGSSTGMLTVTGGTYEAYPIEENVSYAAPKSGYKIVKNENGTYGLAECEYVAQVGDKKFESLQAAVNAVQSGDTVTLLTDIALTEADCVANADRNVLIDVVGKDITLDMNGKKISVVHEDAFTNDYIVAVIRVGDGAGLTVTGDGEIDVKVLAGNPDMAYMFWKRGTTGHLTIENGTYHMNDSADSMVYTNGHEIVTVKGGKFTLDTTGTGENGSPWIFNVQGAGDHSVIVTGGTYNADINRQHWSNEAVVPKTHYVVKNSDNTWTVKEGAVAYVNEGMLTGPYFAPKDVGYATLQEALDAAKGEKDIVINLLDDVTLDITAWQTLAIGGETTETITINGNGKTLTFNKLNSDWNHVATNNDAKLILNDMTITDSGYNNGPWNRYDLNFACDVELNNVTSTKALAFKADATLKTVTVNETGDNYAIWIQANGQTVTIDGLTVTSAGRGIKIDNQYVDQAAKVTLSVSNATFTTAKKAAIMVKNPTGADITVSNVDISNVAADTVNVVWNDEDNVAYYSLVNVTGGTKAQEGEFPAVVKDTEGNIRGYYKTLADAFAAAQDGDEVTILQAGTYALSTSGKDITITGAVDGVVFDNIGAKRMDASVTFNNVTFDYYPNVNYTGLQHSGNLKYNNCIFNGQVFLYGASETFNNCTFNQNSADAYNVWTYSADVVNFNECTFNCAGKSVLIYNESASEYNMVNVTDCDFIASAPVEGKAAIEMDSSLTAGIKLTIDADTTVTGFGTGNVSGNSLWNNKKGNNTDANNDITVIVDGQTVLAPVTFVAKIGNIGYTTLAAAMAAASEGDTVTILAGDYTADIAVKSGITVVGETDAQDNNLVNITGRVSVSSNGTVKNLNVENNKTGDYDCALVVNGKDIVIEGCDLSGYNAMRYCYANGDVTIKNSKLEGSNFTVHFDGSTGANIAFENCEITGWCSYASTVNSVSYTNCSIDQGNYAGHRYYNKNVSFTDCEFAEGMKLDLRQTGSNVAITDADMTVAEAKALFKDPYYVAKGNITLNGDQLTYAASANGKYYDSLQEMVDDLPADGATYWAYLRSDNVLDASVVIPADKKLVINMNGFDIIGKPTEAKAFSVINNKGDLTIEGSGSVVCDHQLAGSTAYAVNTITNSGTLTIDGATIENKSTASNQIGYAIDNNSTTGDAVLVVKSGEVKASGSNYYDGIRLFCNNQTKENSVSVEGGTVSSIWLQNPSDGATEKDTKDVKGTVSITGGTVNALYLEPSSAFAAEITGGYVGKVAYFTTSEGRDLTHFITGGTFGMDVTAYCALGYQAAANTDGTYTVQYNESIVAWNMQTGAQYETVVSALLAAKENETVQLLKDSNEANAVLTVLNGITLDLNGHTLTAYYAITATVGSYIIDSTNGQGLLKVAKNNLVMADNTQLKIWMEEEIGYRFAAVSFKTNLQSSETGEATFRFYLNEANGVVMKELADDATDNDGLTMQVKMTYTNSQGGISTLYFDFPADKIIEYAEKEYSGTASHLYMTIVNLDTVSDVSFTAVIRGGSVMIESAAVAYNG